MVQRLGAEIDESQAGRAGRRSEALLNRSEQLGERGLIEGWDTPYGTAPTGDESEEVRP